MSKRDYYEVLGVSKDEDEKAIKKAYRRVVKSSVRSPSISLPALYSTNIESGYMSADAIGCPEVYVVRCVVWLVFPVVAGTTAGAAPG